MYSRPRDPPPMREVPPQKKVVNGWGVLTSPLSASLIGQRETHQRKAEQNRSSYLQAAAEQGQKHAHVPSKLNCHMQTSFPTTIARLQIRAGAAPLDKRNITQAPSEGSLGFSFASNFPAEAKARRDEFHSTSASRIQNLNRARTCHVDFSQ